jgi:hypothetical protein
VEEGASEGYLVEKFLPGNFPIERLSREINGKEVGLKCPLGQMIIYKDIEAASWTSFNGI